MPVSALGTWSRRLREWAVDDALPFWATAGFDGANGRFEERLAFGGDRLLSVPIRLMVQARQIYVYATAARQGWYPGSAGLVERAFDSMVRDFHGSDGKDGWVFSIDRRGAVVDARRELYAHAFVLLAVASFVQATGRSATLSLADRTLAFIDNNMRAQRGGYVEVLPSTGDHRRQNPHMHLLEGLLALWSISSERRYLERAGHVVDLFESRFFQPASGTLCEYLDDELRPANGIDGAIVEPGHHYEWIWLLRWFERETGRPVARFVDALYGHATEHGFDADGLIVDELLVDGSCRSPSRRLWPITEAIKANVVESRLGRAGAEERAAALTERLATCLLQPATRGGWIDRLDKDGNRAVDHMPASTFYHIVCALDELDSCTSR
jgi:mannose/cellobiose epimerase-like protein (N-acyl-D-glucosamine 2-epimerase family)